MSEKLTLNIDQDYLIPDEQPEKFSNYDGGFKIETKTVKKRKAKPINPDQITLDELIVKPIEDVALKSSIEKSINPISDEHIDPRIEKLAGWCIKLSDRADDLAETIKYCSLASKHEGLQKALFDGVITGYDEKVSRNIEKNAKQNGSQAFLRAFGASALEQAGYSIYRQDGDKRFLNRKLQKENDDFINEYIGPENEKKRNKYRRILAKQKKTSEFSPDDINKVDAKDVLKAIKPRKKSVKK